ncbi:hypothetical protein QWY82_18365 [Simiduia curdlanivorans]|uniref:Uncharacterized protein n=1 Tax=Simiduia curdlanivorans TaxID=1492769 RepID=A0ABV8V725_9GAMM|nr:hypothetical protein [Simiduia curdlanivorans]MDN3640769.1 hypothetical protein [Simiduia curdlanivorans]
MRIFLVIIAIAFIMLQIVVTYLWTETDIIEQFTQVFQGLYPNGIPDWSKVAFSFGRSWYLVSALLIILVALALYDQKSKPALLAIAASSALSFLVMLYAMYPLHIMFSGTAI